MRIGPVGGQALLAALVGKYGIAHTVHNTVLMLGTTCMNVNQLLTPVITYTPQGHALERLEIGDNPMTGLC